MVMKTKGGPLVQASNRANSGPFTHEIEAHECKCRGKHRAAKRHAQLVRARAKEAEALMKAMGWM